MIADRNPATSRFVNLLAIAAMLVGSLLVSGCGYSHQAIYPDNVATVSINILDNRTFYQGVEFDLTEALIKEVEMRTPYKVVREGDADSVITGVVSSIDQTRLSRSSNGGLVQELEVRLTADLVWTDSRNGEPIRDRRGITSVGRYIPSTPVGEPFQVAQHEAVQRLAERFVAAMRADW